MMDFEASAIVSALMTAVLHFLWQGALIALLAAAALFVMRRGSAQGRYFVATAALAASFAVFVATFVTALEANQSAGVAAGPKLVGLALGRGGAATPGIDVLGIAGLWLLGSGLMSARTAHQWMVARGLQHNDLSTVDPVVRASFEAVRRQMGVRRAVRLMQSGCVEVPMVIGWLPPDQLRSILAHEMAHVRRHDYLVNGLQKVVEAILFFHPAVWWLSRRVRAEREQCCDDEVVLIAGAALVYANALYQLETIRAEANPIAMSANGGSIMQRIKRILKSNATDGPSLRGRLAAAVAVAGIAAVAAGIANVSLTDPVVEAAPLAAQVTTETDPKSEAPQETEKGTPEQWAEQIEAAVAAGKLTPEEAESKLAAIANGGGSKDLSADKLIARKKLQSLEEWTSQIEAAVVSGKLTPAEAEAKLQSKEPMSLEQWAERFEAMVAAGKLSAEDAEAKLAVLAAKVDSET